MSQDKKTPDVEVEITNGKTIKVDLSPLEWVIVLGGLTALASEVPGLSG